MGANITEKPNEQTTWKRSYKDSKKALKRKYSLFHSEQQSKKYLVGKRQAIIAYIDTSLKNLLRSTTDWVSK